MSAALLVTLPAKEPLAALPIWSVPALTVAMPEYVLAPLRMSVPVPIFVKPPLPLRTEEYVSVPEATSRAPPLAFTVAGRLRENDPVVRSVPPLKVTAVPASPRLLPAVIVRMPALSVVPPL